MADGDDPAELPADRFFRMIDMAYDGP